MTEKSAPSRSTASQSHYDFLSNQLLVSIHNARHTSPVTDERTNALDFPRCAFSFADGRRCALPVDPQSNGLCYAHAHAPHRRLRPSDLTRELASPTGTPSAAKIRRLLAKLPIALADGTISLREFRVMNYICSSMLHCRRLSATELPLHPHDPECSFVASLPNEEGEDKEDAKFPSFPARS